MTTVQRGPGFPVLAVLLGGLGALCVAAGLAGLFSPGSVALFPALGEELLAGALLVTGALFMAVEGLLVLFWIRRRRDHRR